MLTIWGQQHSPCVGRSRHEFLQIGALGVGGLTLAYVLRLQARAGEPARTPHKAVKRAFDAMMTMRKIDIAAIEAARRG
jgi:hypothetical protein